MPNKMTPNAVMTMLTTPMRDSPAFDIMNDDLSREDNVIAAKQKQLTTQVNLANQILQAIPWQLAGVNILYSAITGYNQKNG